MSSPVERAEQAVTEARARIWWPPMSASEARIANGTLDDLIRAVEARCAARALGELLTDQTGQPDDEAYNRGVTDAARATLETP